MNLAIFLYIYQSLKWLLKSSVFFLCWAWLVNRWLFLAALWYTGDFAHLPHISIPFTAGYLAYSRPFVISSNAVVDIFVHGSWCREEIPPKWNCWVFEYLHILFPQRLTKCPPKIAASISHPPQFPILLQVRKGSHSFALTSLPALDIIIKATLGRYCLI